VSEKRGKDDADVLDVMKKGFGFGTVVKEVGGEPVEPKEEPKREEVSEDEKKMIDDVMNNKFGFKKRNDDKKNNI
jgi:hypothetical protein